VIDVFHGIVEEVPLLMVNVALATVLLVPLFTAIAWMVSVAPTVIAPVYCVEDVVGVDPLVV
jgi:hypothetical protein